MKAELRSGDGPEREDLRKVLRQWHVPPPPPEIEDDLRRTFRRRRAKGRPALWLSIAAALALIAVWRIGVNGRAVTPAPSRPAAALASPPPPPTEAVDVGRPGSASRPAGRPSAPFSAARHPGEPAPAPRQAEVIVEPGQGRLLAELGSSLRDMRQAAPGTSMPRIEAGASDQRAAFAAAEEADVPEYRGGWETVAGEWPYVHRSRQGEVTP